MAIDAGSMGTILVVAGFMALFSASMLASRHVRNIYLLARFCGACGSNLVEEFYEANVRFDPFDGKRYSFVNRLKKCPNRGQYITDPHFYMEKP
jgi:hypothetical protein